MNEQETIKVNGDNTYTVIASDNGYVTQIPNLLLTEIRSYKENYKTPFFLTLTFIQENKQ